MVCPETGKMFVELFPKTMKRISGLPGPEKFSQLPHRKISGLHHPLMNVENRFSMFHRDDGSHS